MRDEFPMSVKEVLAKRVALQCSRLGCGRVTSGPQSDPAKFVNVGVAAHITAASPEGPRYDPSLTPEQRSSHDNGVWLCQTCAKLVDSDPAAYPVETLREWKAFAEARAKQALEGVTSTAPDAAAVFLRLEKLLPALLSEMRQDLAASPLIRQCVVFKKSWCYNSGDTREFFYYLDDHPDLESQFQILENYGLVSDVTTGNCKKYRLSEDLAEYLGSGSGGAAPATAREDDGRVRH
jgi:hypothetical protein